MDCGLFQMNSWTRTITNKPHAGATNAAVGVSGSGVDFLICSVAISRGWQVSSVDADFRAFRKLIPIRLYVRV
jgi:predicted nucleic acid-binding protein